MFFQLELKFKVAFKCQMTVKSELCVKKKEEEEKKQQHHTTMTTQHQSCAKQNKAQSLFGFLKRDQIRPNLWMFLRNIRA